MSVNKPLTAAETMTELQMRLWCLWMCDKFLDPEDMPWSIAMHSANPDVVKEAAKLWFTPEAKRGGSRAGISLRAWQLSERMP